MKCTILCVLVLLCIVSFGYSRPQGFFGGLLPTASPQGESPPKGPLGIFSQGQQNVQKVVGGFIAGLSNAREKIKTETDKRIQAFLNATMGNKNKGDPEVPPEKQEEETDNIKEEWELAPEKEDLSSSHNNKKGSASSPEKIKQPESNEEESDVLPSTQKEQESNDKKKPDDSLEIQNHPETPNKKEPVQKQEAPKNSKPLKSTEATTTADTDLNKIIDEVFPTSSPSKVDMEEKNPDEKPSTTPTAGQGSDNIQKK